MTPPPVLHLPHDLEYQGKWLTQIYRSHREGGNIAYLENSPPGIAFGHKFHAFKINVVNGVEQLGECLTVTASVDRAIGVAGQSL